MRLTVHSFVFPVIRLNGGWLASQIPPVFPQLFQETYKFFNVDTGTSMMAAWCVFVQRLLLVINLFPN